jgi:nitrogen regulatory protein P-II 1
MKEIKAYIRKSMADRVIQQLEQAGVKGMTVIDVAAIAGWADKESFSYSIEYVDKYSTVVKLEIVCEEKDTDVLSEIIVKYGKTGKSGDGMIFISPVEKSIKIKNNQINILKQIQKEKQNVKRHLKINFVRSCISYYSFCSGNNFCTG